MTCGVLIAGVERRNEGGGERKAGSPESIVCCGETRCRFLLLPIEVKKPLCSKRRDEEHEHEFQRIGVIGVDEKRQERNVERQRDPPKGCDRSKMRHRIVATDEDGDGVEEAVCGKHDQ